MTSVMKTSMTKPVMIAASCAITGAANVKTKMMKTILISTSVDRS
jgi:hypothetical protein